eukprot:Amastigsp_a339220_11933.p3 type:complete len:188 gc:universal Amastigsp_a339220_11933:1457-894(-)
MPPRTPLARPSRPAALASPPRAASGLFPSLSLAPWITRLASAPLAFASSATPPMAPRTALVPPASSSLCPSTFLPRAATPPPPTGRRTLPATSRTALPPLTPKATEARWASPCGLLWRLTRPSPRFTLRSSSRPSARARTRTRSPSSSLGCSAASASTFSLSLRLVARPTPALASACSTSAPTSVRS